MVTVNKQQPSLLRENKSIQTIQATTYDYDNDDSSAISSILGFELANFSYLSLLHFRIGLISAISVARLIPTILS